MSLPDLHQIARRIDSPLFQGARDQFHARGGKLKYTSGGRSRFREDEDIKRGGTIFIDTDDIPKMEGYYGSPDEVVRALLIHEMGHCMYRFQDKATQPRKAEPIEPSIDWCLKREAHASMFAFRVVKELKARKSSGHVITPTGTGDLFSALEEAERAGRSMLGLAQDSFTNSAYLLYCREKFQKAPNPTPKIPTVVIVGKRTRR